MIPKELEKALFTGVGMIVVSRQKARKVLDRMVEEAKLSAEDAEKLFEELADSGQDQMSSFKDAVRNAVRGGLDNLDVARGKELAETARRLDNLEKRMAILEGICGKGAKLP
jgi:polyhydroxyalkanoate synthesis regulator phasin